MPGVREARASARRKACQVLAGRIFEGAHRTTNGHASRAGESEGATSALEARERTGALLRGRVKSQHRPSKHHRDVARTAAGRSRESEDVEWGSKLPAGMPTGCGKLVHEGSVGLPLRWEEAGFGKGDPVVWLLEEEMPRVARVTGCIDAS